MHFQSGIQQLLLAAEMVMESGLHTPARLAIWLIDVARYPFSPKSSTAASRIAALVRSPFSAFRSARGMSYPFSRLQVKCDIPARVCPSESTKPSVYIDARYRKE
jgi:hypothetical protein